MTEQEMIMSIADNIIWLTVFSVLGGMLMGWYITFMYYRTKEREQTAVEQYKQETLPPPPSELERVRSAMNTLQKFVTSYHIEWDDTTWDYNDRPKKED